MIISKLLSTLSNDGLLIGLNLGHILLGMENITGQYIFHISVSELRLAQIAPKHSPSRLIVVFF